MAFKIENSATTDNLDWDAWYQKQADTFGRIETKRTLRERYEKIRPDIGLRIFRKKKKLTQIEMSKIMGVSRRTYIDYEHGERAISSIALSLLLVEFDCDLNLLFKQEHSPPSPEQAQKYAQLADQIFTDLQSRFDGLSDEDKWSITGAIIADRSDPSSWQERDLADFVEEHRGLAAS